MGAHKSVVAALLCVLFQFNPAAGAEVVCTADDAQIKTGLFDVKCGAVIYLAHDDAHLKANLVMKEKLDAANKILESKDTLLGQHERLMKQYDTVIEHQKEYIVELETAYKGYKDLAADYKKRKDPWLTFEGGFGAAGDSDPVALAGIGIGRFRIWKSFQKGNGGWLAGVSLPFL